jgi:hypothetical protein
VSNFQRDRFLSESPDWMRATAEDEAVSCSSVFSLCSVMPGKTWESKAADTACKPERCRLIPVGTLLQEPYKQEVTGSNPVPPIPALLGKPEPRGCAGHGCRGVGE